MPLFDIFAQRYSGKTFYILFIRFHTTHWCLRYVNCVHHFGAQAHWARLLGQPSYLGKIYEILVKYGYNFKKHFGINKTFKEDFRKLFKVKPRKIRAKFRVKFIRSSNKILKKVCKILETLEKFWKILETLKKYLTKFSVIFVEITSNKVYQSSGYNFEEILEQFFKNFEKNSENFFILKDASKWLSIITKAV